ncbi:MAG: AraC family transcriptional regulator [Bacteroidaceae bacterium]|nr:AraC family transcriptional regulator [Bacteroidaceae bacterium]
MSPITPSPIGGYNARYVEYVDVFTQRYVNPSATLKDGLLLFDSEDGSTSLVTLLGTKPNKIYQKINIYITQGQAQFVINEQTTTISAGYLVTIMPENTTLIKSASTDFAYFATIVYPKLSSLIYTDIGYIYSNARLSLRHFISPVSAEHMQKVRELYNEMKHDMNGADYELKEMYVRCLMDVLIIENINIHKYNPMLLQGNSNSRQYDTYCRFLALLNKHAAEQRTVYYYANLMGISSKYLSFVCISYSQKNASTWIDEAVIQKAKALMVVHHYSFSDTSNALHFPTVSSFCRFFKRVTGTTPKAYVKSLS